MTSQELLREVRDLLREHWAQGHEARDANGAPTLAFGGAAVRWSLPAAIGYVANLNEVDPVSLHEAKEAIRRATVGSFPLSIQDWNDLPSQNLHRVLDAVDTALRDLMITERYG
jgi:hypothetical protein